MTEMVYSRIFLYAASLLMFIALTAHASTEAQVLNYRVEGISASMSLDEIKQTLESAGYSTRSSGSYTTARILFTKTGSDNVKRAIMVSKNGEARMNIRVEISLPPGDSYDPEHEGQEILSKLGQPSSPCTAKKQRWSCDFSTEGAAPVARVKARILTRSKVIQVLVNRDAEKQLQELAQARRDTGIDCFASADATSYEQVFKCMSGYRFSTGENVFVNNIRTSSCTDIVHQYGDALRKSGISDHSEFVKLTPSCEIFAHVTLEMTGKPAYWSGCLGYPGTSLSDHIERCLESNIANAGGQPEAGLRNYKSCPQVISEYERLLSAATPTRQLPRDYQQPDCATVNVLVAQWSGQDIKEVNACTGYDPSNMEKHMESCLALSDRQLFSLHDCPMVRQLYEQKLIAANGKLPENYITLPCSETKGILTRADQVRAEYAEQMAQARKKREEEIAKQAQAANQAMREEIERIQKSWERWDVGNGQIIPTSMFSKEEADSFKGYEQPGILLALAHARLELLNNKREAVLMYMATLHDTFASEEMLKIDPQCYAMQDPGVKHAMDDHLMRELGITDLLSGNLKQGSALAVDMGIALIAQIGSGDLYTPIRNMDNIELLQDRAMKDAMLLALRQGCGSDSVKSIYKNIQRFVAAE